MSKLAPKEARVLQEHRKDPAASNQVIAIRAGASPSHTAKVLRKHGIKVKPGSVSRAATVAAPPDMSQPGDGDDDDSYDDLLSEHKDVYLLLGGHDRVIVELKEIAKSVTTDPKKLLRLASHKHRVVREAVAGNRSIPPKAAEMVVNDPDNWVRAAAASNFCVPPQLLASMVDDNSLEVRRCLARNPSTPQESLARLATEKRLAEFRCHPDTHSPTRNETNEWDMRMLVAENPSASPEVLTGLAEDSVPRVRAAVAGNESTPPELLLNMASNINWYERLSDSHYKHSSCFLAPTPSIVSCEVAQNQSPPPKALDLLADAGTETRELVVQNPAASLTTLRRMAKHESAATRELVAKQQRTPPSTLAKLTKDENVWVRIAAAANPSTPVDAVTQMCNDSQAAVRVTVARNPALPPENLAPMASDANSHVRFAVAQNYSTPLPVLFKLADYRITSWGGRGRAHEEPSNRVVDAAKETFAAKGGFDALTSISGYKNIKNAQHLKPSKSVVPEIR